MSVSCLTHTTWVKSRMTIFKMAVGREYFVLEKSRILRFLISLILMNLMAHWEWSICCVRQDNSPRTPTLYLLPQKLSKLPILSFLFFKLSLSLWTFLESHTFISKSFWFVNVYQKLTTISVNLNHYRNTKLLVNRKLDESIHVHSIALVTLMNFMKVIHSTQSNLF